MKWLTSYLSERYLSIKIGSTVSELLFGVPQGSVLGPLLFSLYTTPLSLVIGKHKGIKFHFYEDDTQVYIHLSHKNSCAAFEQLNRCLDDVKEWVSASKLKLNPNKTEFIVFGSKRQRDMLKAYFPVTILGSSLCPAESIKNFSLSKHVQNVYKSCFVQLCDLRYVRQALFRSLSKFNLRKLQCIQNSAARIISNTSRYTSITLVLKKLHWLPVEHRSVFKTATLHIGFPKYFPSYISSYCSSYSTRFSQSGGNFFVIPKFQPSIHKSVNQFGYSFAFDAPTVWNALPDEICASPYLTSFRKHLKTNCITRYTHLGFTHPLPDNSLLVGQLWTTSGKSIGPLEAATDGPPSFCLLGHFF